MEVQDRSGEGELAAGEGEIEELGYWAVPFVESNADGGGEVVAVEIRGCFGEVDERSDGDW